MASSLSYMTQGGNARLGQKLVHAKNQAQMVVQAQPSTPALAPLVSTRQPQFDVCILWRTSCMFHMFFFIKETTGHVCAWCDGALGINRQIRHSSCLQGTHRPANEAKTTNLQAC